MFRLISISPEPSNDPELSSYVLHVETENETLSYWAEVRPGSNGDQIDWADEFQDLLLQHDILATHYEKISDAIHSVHCKVQVMFPLSYGAA